MATVQRLLQAAERQIGARGVAAVGLADILREAQVSVGSFYARFESKDALVRHLAERFWRDTRVHWTETLDAARWAGRSPADLIRGVVRSLVESHRHNRTLWRAFIQYGLARSDTRFLKPVRELDASIVGTLAERLETLGAPIAHSHPRTAVELGYLQLVGTLRTLIVVGWPKREAAPVGDEALALELARGYLAYLGLKAGD